METIKPLPILILIALAWLPVALSFHDIRKGWLAGFITLVSFNFIAPWLSNTMRESSMIALLSPALTSLAFIYFIGRDKAIAPEKSRWLIASFVSSYAASSLVIAAFLKNLYPFNH